MATPERIWIVGSPGSGKSTVCARLAERLGLEPSHLDDQFWLPGWQERTKEDFRARVAEICSRPRWVIDGNYRAVREPFLSRAELVVWLDLPFHVVFSRVVWRTAVRATTRRLICNGNRESMLRSLFTRDSILWWTLTQFRRYRIGYERELAEVVHVRLRSVEEVERWFGGFG